MLWSSRLTGKLFSYGRVVLVEAAAEYGLPHLIKSLQSEDPRVLWVQLEPEDAGDKIGIGDKLADAAAKAFESRLYGNGLPYSYGVSVLKRHIDVLAPLTVVLTNADYGRQLASALYALSRTDTRILIQFIHVPTDFDIPAGTVRVTASDLMLTQGEAAELARARLSDPQVELLRAKSGGAYETYLNSINTELGLPRVLRPSPQGAIEVARIPSANSAALFDALISGKLWMEAFEIAAQRFSNRASEVVDKAGDAAFEGGYFSYFWNTIKLLPEDVLKDETVAYWYLAAALATNNHKRVQEFVRSLLVTGEYPELRALAAISLPTASMIDEVERAFFTRKTAVTTRAVGFAYAVSGRPGDAIDYLKTAYGLAREYGKRNLMVASSNELAIAYQMAGAYKEAYRWASWALKQFNEFGMKEELRRLEIVNEVAFPALLTDNQEFVTPLLEAVVIPEDLYGIPSLEGILSTLSDFHLQAGRYEEAESCARINYKHLPVDLLGFSTNALVRCLLFRSRPSEAVAIADATYCNAQLSGEVEKLRATLALGTALAWNDPRQALQHLEYAQQGFNELLSGPYLAQATLVLAVTYMRLGEHERARSALVAGDAGIRELGRSGWLLLGGPFPEIDQLWAMWNQETVQLEIRFLGATKIRHEHKVLSYPLRWCEILAVLAFHPDGLSGERLSALLYGDGGNMSTLKANLSRMRKEIPVSSRPYRIELPYVADFVEVDKALRAGNVREALDYYRGPLLPASEAPFIVELRDYLEEGVRQAALNSGDMDVVLSLARKLGDDLELWETVCSGLAENDPMRALAHAQIKRIERSWSS